MMNLSLNLLKYIFVLVILLMIFNSIIAQNVMSISDIYISIWPSDKHSSFAMIFDNVDSSIPIKMNSYTLYREGVIYFNNLRINKKINKPLIVEITFNQMHLIELNSSEVIIIAKKHHLAFGTNIVFQFKSNKLYPIHFKCIAVSWGEFILIILIFLFLILALLMLLSRKYILALIFVGLIGQSLLVWFFIKLWQVG